ncbi:MAG: type II toxin-antitoxin system RelE/ParE family toxin [Chitinophagales bacterium]
MKVEFLKQFSKDLDKLNSKSTKRSLLRVIESLEVAENLETIPNSKKLKGFKSAYRIRIGDYRLGLFYENSTVLLARFAHRKEIYGLFP